jgi:NADPH2:quinone reductase
MERVVSRALESYSRYGSSSFKQVYVYGALDLGPTILNRSFGFSWSDGGWLLFPFLQKAGAETAQRLRNRVAAEYNSTFASHYTDTISLRGALGPANVRAYERKSTGTKYLINPQL